MGKRKPQASAVHRGLPLASPPVKGPDVKALQAKLNERAESMRLPWLHVKKDGQAGKRTIRSARLLGWAIGLDGKPLTLLEHDRVSRYAQRVLRGDVKRTDAQRQLARARGKQLDEIRRKHNVGANAAVKLAGQFVGQTESPANSNRGPNIVSRCQLEIIGYDGVPWCGCFVGYVLRSVGVQGITSRIAYTPYIIEDGRQHRNGMAGIVPFSQAKPGDLAVMNFPGGSSIADHVGMVIAAASNGRVKTREGNTSSGTSGSQSNGGGVYERTRYTSEVAAIVRPAYV